MTAAALDRKRIGELRRSRFSGELGLWPVAIALVLIAVGFQLAAPAFLSARNITNLTLQTATLGTLTVGIVLVLLIGEIDLSIGSVSGLTACIMGLLITTASWPAIPAILVALAAGAAIGLLQGAWIVLFRAPSFIVTLAGLLIWQGVQLASLNGQGGQLRIDDPFIISISSDYLSVALGWILAVLVAVAAGAFTIVRRRLRASSGLGNDPLLPEVLRVAGAVVLSIGTAAVLNSYLGIPLLLVILLAMTIVFAIVSGATVFGRHIYAVGGNAEAARRAGVRVRSLRLVIFTLASTLAAAGGVLEASRAFSVSVNSGGGNTSLDAIAAAVIGGTSLFGGRGRLVGALLGALVISSVQNGLELIGGSASAQSVATGLILLAAITLDVTARRQRLSMGTAGA